MLSHSLPSTGGRRVNRGGERSCRRRRLWRVWARRLGMARVAWPVRPVAVV